MLDIDVQGAKKLKSVLPDAVFIFILPPSFAELRERLHGRASESDNALKTRLNNAIAEMNEYVHYEYIVVNDELDTAIDKIQSILIAEHCRKNRAELPEGLIALLRGNINDLTE